MKTYKGYLIDLDGTIYQGSSLIEGAKAFIQYLRNKRLPHLFVTNNSTRTPEAIAQKLQEMGIHASPEQMITSSIATAHYITKKESHPTVYMIGEQGLKEALQYAGCDFSNEKIEYVVIGLDRAINYEKIATASLHIQQGATFISTNKDPAIPEERGLLPGNGAITAAVERASGAQPIYIGKPENTIIETALDQLGLSHKEVLMIGDNYLTDIQAGINIGMDTLMVLTGFSRKEDIQKSIGQPTYIMKNLGEWMGNIGTR